MEDISISSSNRVLVICLDGFGDIVLRAPLFHALRTKGCTVYALVRSGYEQILPYIDPAIVAVLSPLDPFGSPGENARRLVHQLGQSIENVDPDIVIGAAYDRTFVESWCLRYSRATRAVAFDIDEHRSLNAQPAWLDVLPPLAPLNGKPTLVSVPRSNSEADKNDALLKAIWGDAPSNPPRLRISEADRLLGMQCLKQLGLHPKTFVVGCPAAANVSTKAIPPSLFSDAIVHALKRRDERLLLMGRRDEQHHVLETAAQCERRGLHVSTWFGEKSDFGTFLAVLEQSKLYFGSDTGSVHFAAALEVPVVSVFGGGHWPRFLPTASVSHVCTRVLPCFGCGWQCWFKEPHCITSVSATRIAEGIEAVFEMSEKSGERPYQRVDEHLPSSALATTLLEEGDFGDECRASSHIQYERERATVASALKTLASRREAPSPSPPRQHPSWRGTRSRDDEPISIDVVVPSFNQGLFLRQAIDSILEQQQPGVSIYVMDGGSTDETLAILKEYSRHFRHCRTGPDDGQAAAITEGVQLGSGQLVTWLNSDDYFLPGAFRRLRQAFERHPYHGLYIGNGLRLSQDSGATQPFCRRHLALNRDALANGLDYVLQPSTFFLRAAWEDVGGLDTKLHFGLDWDLILRVAARWPAALINEFLAVSREWASTKTSRGGAVRVEELIRIAHAHTGEPLTRGGLYYSLESALTDGRHSIGEIARAKVGQAMGSLRDEFKSAYGNSDGFPEFGDPQDSIDLPLATSAGLTGAGSAQLPSISLVMPSYGQAQFIERAIDSVLTQEYPRLEMLVFDGGSQDGTQNILENYGPRLSKWTSERDRGPAHAINKGFREAKGDILGWLNSDDMLAQDALFHVARAFADDPDLQLVYGNALYIDESDKLACPDHGGHRTGLYYGQFQPVANIPYYWTYVHSVPQPTVFFRRSLINQVGLLDESYKFIFDFELFARFASSGATTLKIEKTLAFYRLHSAAKTSGWHNFLEELYRYSRPKWPAATQGAFWRTVRSFRRHIGAQQFGERPWRWYQRLFLFGVSAMVILRLGNPESFTKRRIGLSQRWRSLQRWRLPSKSDGVRS